MASSKKSQIEALLAPAVHALGLDLWGVELALSNSRGLLRVYIDHQERPITLTDCESVSREASALLDVHDPIAGNYTLEVSSPGIERPLFTLAQFARHVGESAKVVLRLPQEGRRRLQGPIVRIEAERIVFLVDNAEMSVAFENVDKARIMPDWVALGFAPQPKKTGAAKPVPAKVAPKKTATAKKATKKAARKKPARKSASKQPAPKQPGQAKTNQPAAKRPRAE